MTITLSEFITLAQEKLEEYGDLDLVCEDDSEPTIELDGDCDPPVLVIA